MPKIINAKKAGFVNYAEHGENIFPQRPIKRRDKLGAGIYGIGVDQSGNIFFIPASAMTDDLIKLPNFTSEKVIAEIDKFWGTSVRKRYADFGMVYKRGIILHGRQGTGKTSIIARVMESHVEKGGIVFFCPSPGLLSQAAKIIREVEGDVPLLIIYEEFDALIRHDEGGFLSLLDGEDQIDNVVYVATTNYLDRIPPRIRNRPSRFASIIEVGLPDAETRRTFLQAKIKDTSLIDMDLWVQVTNEMTIDQIKDLIISVLCIDIPLEEAVKKLIDMDGQESSNDDEDDNVQNKLLKQLLSKGRKSYSDLVFR